MLQKDSGQERQALIWIKRMLMEPIGLPQFDAARAVKTCGYPKAPYFNAKLTVSEGVCLRLSDVPKAV